ncbi:hypothetical protein F5J12DRAFT_899139 [Pisolithus orientalis]|uniref:uncharacterized protein n=1 Tax=Pisolithus orientalis TaxID=936130 RepID=UPI00222575C8|nr:uncharacterized protein F5J12DRAFT_899139 [Pisolithus orientalis]KAI5984966.1 hypothetical protein F5J12DRAFT_899139 [Pisolithus orientalis]
MQVYPAVYFTWFSLVTDFQSAFYASALYWATALGVPTWYQIYQNWLPCHIQQLQEEQQHLAEVLELIGMYQHVQGLQCLLPPAPKIPKQIMELPNEVPDLERHEVPAMFLNPPEQPPHYLLLAIPDQDDEADLDLVLWYTEQEEPIALPPPVHMPTPEPEMVQEVYDALATAEAVAAEINLADLNAAEFELLF